MKSGNINVVLLLPTVFLNAKLIFLLVPVPSQTDISQSPQAPFSPTSVAHQSAVWPVSVHSLYTTPPCVKGRTQGTPSVVVQTAQDKNKKTMRENGRDFKINFFRKSVLSTFDRD